jgi:hypothetical protein
MENDTPSIAAGEMELLTKTELGLQLLDPTLTTSAVRDRQLS